MHFDNYFEYQENNVPLLPGAEHPVMRGTGECPVIKIGRIDFLELPDILDPSLDPLDAITITVIVSRRHRYASITKNASYYMRFLFYDFDKAIYLFLYNAKAIKVNDVPVIGPDERYRLVITSANKDSVAAYKVFKMKYDAI